jgi:uncharacterized membrane protein YheB (UPF0754 family)
MVSDAPPGNDRWYAHEWTHWVIAGLLVGAGVVLSSRLEANWFEAALFIVTGAFAGYLTNEIAVTLLLWPTEPRLGGALHGVFYKRRNEFGGRLIDEACRKFLNPELFVSLLQDEAVDAYVRRTVAATVADLASTDLGSFRNVVAVFVSDDEQRELMFDRVSAMLGNYVADFAFARADEERVLALLEALTAHAANIPLQGLRDRRPDIEAGFESVWDAWFCGVGAERVRDFLAAGMREILSSEAAIGEIIPEESRKSLEALLMNYLSDRFQSEVAGLLRDESFRAKAVPLIVEEIRRIVHLRVEGLQGIKGTLIRMFGARDLEDALERLPAEVDRFLSEKVPEFVSHPQVLEYVKSAASRGLGALWNTRISTIGAALSDEALQAIGEAPARALASPRVRARAVRVVVDRLCDERFSRLGDIIPGLTDSSHARTAILRLISEHLLNAISDETNRKTLRAEARITARRVIIEFLDAPLPRLADLPFFKPRGLESLADSAANVTARKLRDLAPELVRHFPIREKLYELWNSMTNEQIRSTVDGALSREFKVLVNMGISFGALVGFISFALQSLGGPMAVTAACLVFLPAVKLFKWRITARRS